MFSCVWVVSKATFAVILAPWYKRMWRKTSLQAYLNTPVWDEKQPLRQPQCIIGTMFSHSQMRMFLIFVID